MRAHVTAALCFGALAACLFPALDGLSGGDAASDASNDVAADVVVPEAGADVVKAARFCDDASVRFCEDFDGLTGFSNWPDTTMQNGVTFSLVPSDASSPSAVRFVQVPQPDGGSPFGAIEHDFSSPPITSSAHLAFDFRTDSLPTFGEVKPIVTIQFDASLWPAIDDCVGLGLTATTGELFECVPTDAGTSTYPSHALTGHATLGKWTHVDIDMLFAPKDIVVSVTFDGTSVLAPTKLDSRVVYAAPALQLGLVATDPKSSMDLMIDNLTLDWK